MNLIEIAGKQLEWTRCSPQTRQPDLPPIVLLHEGLGSVSMWRDFPQQLADRCGTDVYVYSRSGYGGSDPAELPRAVNYMHVEAQQVLPVLLERLSIHRPVLLGHSDGGSITLIAAGSGELALSGAIVMAPHIFVEPISVSSIAEAEVAWQQTSLRDRLGKYHANVDNAFRGWNDIWLHPDFLAWSIEQYLPKIACPLMAIQGYDDQYGTMAQIDGIAAALPQTRLVKLDDCGHSPHRDQPDAVLQVCAEFMQALGAA